LVSGDTAFGLLAVGGERARAGHESDLAQLSALAAQAAMSARGRLAGAGGDALAATSRRRAASGCSSTSLRAWSSPTVARQGFTGAVTDRGRARRAAAVFSESQAQRAGSTPAIARLVAEQSCRVAGPPTASRPSSGSKRDHWLLLPEIRLPLAEIVRQSAQKIGAYQLIERIGAGGMARSIAR